MGLVRRALGFCWVLLVIPKEGCHVGLTIMDGGSGAPLCQKLGFGVRGLAWFALNPKP